MKKYIYVLAFAMFALVGCKDNSGLYGLLNDYDARISELEQLCAQMNTNIVSLQQIVSSSQAGDYITNVSPITQSGATIGYTITFAKSGAITIYNGKDGKDGVDGTNGTNGANGHSPVIGVKQDTDGVYYWTLDGAWLTDENNNKVRVTGRDGANGTNGQDGQDGINGTNGTNGTDGVTPQLKIENDYWYISYNNGATWTQLGKATGEDGAKGDKGDTGEKGDKGDTGEKGDKGDKGDTGNAGMNGQDGNTVFTAVEYDDNFVYFTLVDGQVIKVSRFSSNSEVDSRIVDGAIMYEFSVSPTKKVYFSQGNLQYNAALGSHLCADGTTKPGTWRFAEQQYDVTNFDCTNASATCTEWQDLFPYGTSGYNGCEPYVFDRTYYSITGGYYYPSYHNDNIYNTYYDWGAYNAISNGGNQPSVWRLLTKEEGDYVMSERPNADILCFNAIVRGVVGYVILPDNWSILYNPDYKNTNRFTNRQWDMLESAGAVFFPRRGCFRTDMAGSYRYDECVYWTGTIHETYPYYAKSFLSWGSTTDGERRRICNGNCVRLVKDVE